MKAKFDFEEIEKRFSFSGMLFSLIFVVIFDVIGAAIVALIVRKKAPETF